VQLAPESVEGVVSGLVGSGGEFVFGDTRFAVEQLSMLRNVLQVQISGESEVADHFFTDLADFLNSIDPQRNFSDDKEQARTYQTIAVAQLSISVEQMFSERLRKYLNERVVPQLNVPDAQAELRLTHL